MILPIRMFFSFARNLILSLVSGATEMVVCTRLTFGLTDFLPLPGLDPPLVSILSITTTPFLFLRDFF